MWISYVLDFIVFYCNIIFVLVLLRFLSNWKKLWVSFLFFYNCEPSSHGGFPSHFVLSTHNSNYLCILFWLITWIQTSRNVIPKERWWLPLKQKGIIRVNMFFILRGHSFSFCIVIFLHFFVLCLMADVFKLFFIWYNFCFEYFK